METTERLQREYQLVCDAREGRNSRAFAHLMDTYRRPLYLLLLRLTRNTDTADDLTIETFAKAFLQLHRYTPTSTFGAWLYSIGVNTCIDHLRRNRLQTIPLSHINSDKLDVDTLIHSRENQSTPQSLNLSCHTTESPEDSLIRLQRDQNLRGLIDSLKEPYRQIIQLRYYQDLSYNQIADQLHIPVGTVKIRLSRAKQLLAELIRNSEL